MITVTPNMVSVTVQKQDGVTITLNQLHAEQLMGILGGISHPDSTVVGPLWQALANAGIDFESMPWRLRRVGSHAISLVKEEKSADNL